MAFQLWQKDGVNHAAQAVGRTQGAIQEAHIHKLFFPNRGSNCPDHPARKGIYKKEGEGVNGVYNQDFSNRTILIEVGGPENTIDEVYETLLVLSEVLTEVINNDQN